MIHVFIISSKGIPAQYGGFETFIENMNARRVSKDIQYHVSCMNDDERHFIYNNSDCFNVKVPMPGALGRILHVARVLVQVEAWIKAQPNENTIIYILGCRIGPLLRSHARKLHKLGAQVWCNPDGQEWKRAKWNAFAQLFLRYCEKCLVKNSDLVICDSMTIEKYIIERYPDKQGMTKYIAYGAQIGQLCCSEEKLQAWYEKHSLRKDGYYLIVGRFVPENNYETIIREFMHCKTKRDLVLITNVENNRFYKTLLNQFCFDKDSRIKFVGTVYDAELLSAIRANAYGYLHGHSVGGTNPSLLEALATTRLSLLYDVSFNREVAQDSALYWPLDEGRLASLLEKADALKEEQISMLDAKSTDRIRQEFSWEKINNEYEMLWLNNLVNKGISYYKSSSLIQRV